VDAATSAPAAVRVPALEVPREVLEAGEVDGTGQLASTRKITLPIVSRGLSMGGAG
jgi:ABC-type glycerol-3-phosphate transport system permease component